MGAKLVVPNLDWLDDQRGLRLTIDLRAENGLVIVARETGAETMEVRLRFEPEPSEPPDIKPLGASWGDVQSRSASLGIGPLSGTEGWSRTSFEVLPAILKGESGGHHTEYRFQLNLNALRVPKDAERIRLFFAVELPKQYLQESFKVWAGPHMSQGGEARYIWDVAEFAHSPVTVSGPAAVPAPGADASIFISYERGSEAVADVIREGLKQANFQVWQDTQNIRGTQRWPVVVNQALQDCARLVLLLTPKSMASEEVFNEWFYFYYHRKPIHCLMVETCEPHYQLLPFQYLDWRAPAKPWERLIEDLRAPFEWPALARRERVVNTPFAPERTLPEALRALHQALLTETPVALRDEQLEEVVQYKPTDETTFRLGRYAAWCGQRYRLDERFVRLTLLLDQGEEQQMGRWAAQPERFSDLRDVLARDKSPALVLLGAPGAGKSTLLRRLEMDIAADMLRQGEQEGTLTFFVSLADYGRNLPDDKLPDPFDWLSERWQRRYPDLPPLGELLAARRMLLLLDSLNEMPHTDRQQFQRRAALWRTFVHQYVRDLPGNQALFACRWLDYGGVLSVKDNPVPQIRIEAMTPQQVREYLDNYIPDHADAIWANFKRDRRQFELFRIPFWLQMLVDRVRHEGAIPQGRAETLSGFVRRLLHREVTTDEHNPFNGGVLLTHREARRFWSGRPPWRTHELPEEGALVPGLTHLAYTLQERKPGEDKGQVTFDEDEALDILPAHAEEILAAGCSLGVLDETEEGALRFFHQLVQEYFAARRLAREPRATLVHREWHVERVIPALQDQLAQLADSEPLPLLPQTGWEETTLLAAAMTGDAESFVRALVDVNLPLAARCAAAPDVPVSDVLCDEIRQALIARTTNPEADLRARIAAGLALGEIGDTRFKRCSGPYGDYLLLPLIPIPAGEYPIGSDEGLFDNETPAHTVPLEAFQIGQFPVTNAEYALFIAAGGYEDERWWETKAARAWQRGEGTSSGQKAEVRDTWKALQNWTEEEIWAGVPDRWTRRDAESYIWLKGLDEDRLEAMLEERFGADKQLTQPEFWDDADFNNPLQPVVGICWHEARAYAAWLSAQSGLDFRLPREVEWEAAARGREGRRYPYGPDFQAVLSNTYESHIRKTTPVGVFPGGETPEGAADLSGNVWEWTSTIYRPYPYDATDGRENPHDADARRVVRGGSWGLPSGLRPRRLPRLEPPRLSRSQSGVSGVLWGASHVSVFLQRRSDRC